MPTVKEFCREQYSVIYDQEMNRLLNETAKNSRNGIVSDTKRDEIETYAQKEAIMQATMGGLRQFPETEAAEIWRSVYETHIQRKSGIDNAEVISKVVSADQSWKKSSGHAFEEMIKILGTAALRDCNIELLLQRDLNTLIKAQELGNEPRDISWLKEQIKASIFDLYAVVTAANGKKYCYGCIQNKTSIRDRVTRDREPSIQAMQSFFWSTIIVLDGDFLKNPKFISMVNGGTAEHEKNGWHGMYVFSNQCAQDRIYPIHIDFSTFREHAITAANYWLKQRQWFNEQWRADNN